MPSSRLVTAWAATQSQILRVFQPSQVTSENQAAAANSSPGCIAIGNSVPTAAASGVSAPIGTFGQSASITNRITNPRKKNSSITGTIAASPQKRTARKLQASARLSGQLTKGSNALR